MLPEALEDNNSNTVKCIPVKGLSLFFEALLLNQQLEATAGNGTELGRCLV